MAMINKPDMTNLWASGGAIIAPSPAKVQTGWTAEIPPHQWENWVQNRQDLALGYLFQRGLAEWDATTEYYANKSVVLHEGTIYIANTNNVGKEPSDVSSEWRTLFSDIPVATESQQGTVKIATTAQSQALTADDVAITPKKLADALPFLGVSPAGIVVPFAGHVVPQGWLLCNGAAVSRSSYAALFAAIGTTYGSGNGSTTFNLPDLRGEFLRGVDSGRGVDPGRGLGSWQSDALQNMTGHLDDFYGGSNMNANGVFNNEIVGIGPMFGGGTQARRTTGGFIFDAARVARTAHETRPRNIAMNYIIKY